MNLFNQWTVLILGIWFCNALGILFKREPNCDFSHAFWITIAIGFGYLILKT
jgi:hypothetical protein